MNKDSVNNTDNNQKDESLIVNFLDVDAHSGKMYSTEQETEDFAIPKVSSETANDVPVTEEMQELIEGTYSDNQEKRRQEQEEKEVKNKTFKAKLLIFFVVFVAVLSYGLVSYLSLNKVVAERNIKIKTEFLSNNAVYANDIKSLYQQLATNASNYQDEIIYESSMKSKAESVEQTIDDKISSLKSAEENFVKYDAKILYDILLARLTEVKRLSDAQQNGGEVRDIVITTNEFIVNENDNAETYNKALKAYLADNKIPYKESNGAIVYTVD